MAIFSKATKLSCICMFIIVISFVFICFTSSIQAGEMGADKKGLKVTILLFSGRLDPTYVLEDRDVIDQLKTLLDKAPVNEKIEKRTVIPSILGYNGILVDNQGRISGFPSRLAVYKGNIEVKDERKKFLIDEGGAVENLLIHQALRQGVIDEKALKFIESEK